MNETGVQYTLSRVFHDATGDDDGAGGALTKDAFARTLRSARLGLAKTEIDALYRETEKNRDGSIAYREYEPVAREWMTRRVEGEYAAASMYETGDELLKLVLTAFDAVSGGEARVPSASLGPGQSVDITTYQGHDWQFDVGGDAGGAGAPRQSGVWTVSAARDGNKQTLAMVQGRWVLRKGRRGSPELAPHPAAAREEL